MSHYVIYPDINNVEPLISAINAATEQPLANEVKVVVLVTTKAMLSGTAMLQVVRHFGIEPNDLKSSDNQIQLNINETPVLITYAKDSNMEFGKSVVIGAWGGKKILEILKAAGLKSDSILVPLIKDSETFPEKTDEDQWVKDNNATELPLELLE
jgi:hypothetical protein